MKKLRFLFAMFAAKSASLLMRLLGRNATYLPGKIALKLCPGFLGQITPPKTVIAVTGTNGKTTVSNLLASVLHANGYRVTNNSLGSNVQAGVAAALLADSTVGGEPKKDIAVLEVDERSSLLIYPYLKPDYLICNNLMRDSIKRNAHTDFIRYIIDRALPEGTKLILNADDLICSSLGSKGQPRVHFGVSVEKPEDVKEQYVRDLVYCPQCGGALEAEYIRYNHIGRFRCRSCGLTSPAPDYCVTGLDRENRTFTVSHSGRQTQYHLVNDNVVNIYNACGVVALLSELGLSDEQIRSGFSHSQIVKSRYGYTQAGEFRITVQASKGQNPIACARSLCYAAQSAGQSKCVILLPDDRPDNTNNSENICWLYDSDYSYLTDPSIRQIIFAGPRCKDHRLRALIAGVPEENICIQPEFFGSEKQIDTAVCKDIYILHDIYLQKEAAAIRDFLVRQAKGADEA